MKKRINLEIDDTKLFDAIKKQAKKEDRTLKSLVKLALRKYLDNTVK